jgi:hypothetical protein
MDASQDLPGCFYVRPLTPSHLTFFRLNELGTAKDMHIKEV